MYNELFFLDKPIGNNSFSFQNRDNKKIYIPSLKKIDNFDDIVLQSDKSKIAFEDFGFDYKLLIRKFLGNNKN